MSDAELEDRDEYPWLSTPAAGLLWPAPPQPPLPRHQRTAVAAEHVRAAVERHTAQVLADLADDAETDA